MRKLYVILVEHCMKWIRLFGLKGSNYYKNVENAYNFIIKSKTDRLMRFSWHVLRFTISNNNKY